MNKHPTADRPCLVTGLNPDAPQRSLLFALTGPESRDVLTRLERLLEGLCGRDPAPGDADASAPDWIPVPVRPGAGRPLFVSTPEVVRSFWLPADNRRARAELLRQAADGRADAVAVTDRGLARHLTRRAPCSVWFVPEGARPALRRLLVPVDFSPQSADSLRLAVTLACLAGAGECVALHAYRGQAVLTGPETSPAQLREARESFGRFIKPIDTLGVKVTPSLQPTRDVAGAVEESVAEMRSDLVVLASRGRTGPASLLGPTLAERVVASSRVPVLVVKHFGAARGLLSLLAERLRCRTSDTSCN